MKPMLIMPPAPERWPAIQDLLQHEGAPWLTNLERRFREGVPAAHDALAVIPAGSQLLASAAVSLFGNVGVLGHCYTRPEHRKRGYARQLVDTVRAWFSMLGGRWLFLSTTAELDAAFYGRFGFELLRRAVWAPYDRVTMLWAREGATTPGPADLGGTIEVRPVTRAHWPAMVALLQYRVGPDPRIPLDESAVNAEALTLDLLAHQDRGAGLLLGAFCDERLVGLGSVALDRRGEQTYAILIPHTGYPVVLRDAATRFAQSRGFSSVDFPMERLGGWVPGPAGGPAGGGNT